MKSHPPTFNTTYSYSILCRICLCGQQSTSIICILMRALSGRTPVGLSSHFMALHSKQDGDQTSLNPCLLTGKAALWRQDRSYVISGRLTSVSSRNTKAYCPKQRKIGAKESCMTWGYWQFQRAKWQSQIPTPQDKSLQPPDYVSFTCFPLQKKKSFLLFGGGKNINKQ